MRRMQWFSSAAVLAILAVSQVCFAQTNSSAVSGVVRDPSQAVVSGATVTMTNVETGVTRSAQSDAQGRYRIGEIPPGTYQATASMTGFSKQTRQGVVLVVGQEQPLNFSLQVGTVEQDIVVTGAAPMVETTTAAVAAAVTQEQLRE